MPELPDIVYIVKMLSSVLPGRTITGAAVAEPVVLRLLVPESFEEALKGRTIRSVSHRGPFIVLALEGLSLIMHLMLAGRLQHIPSPILPPDGQKSRCKKIPHLCFSLFLDDGSELHYRDDKRMGKIYVTPPDTEDRIPGFLSQGMNVMSPDFTLDVFLRLIEKRRNQARVFLMDQTLLSAIGNAYADEILFHAKIHPKTLCSQLDDEEKQRFYESIRTVLQWGMEKVEQAGRPIEEKVRDHMKVRNRKDSACPVCGTTIRRASVLGYECFFCPSCQPAKRRQFIEWTAQR